MKPNSRILLTHVGTSLLDCNAMTMSGNVTFRDWRERLKIGEIPSGEYGEKLRREWGDALAKKLAVIWAGKEDESRKRKKAPAEIASLGLLKPRLLKAQLVDEKYKGDRVILLHSDTPDGHLCAQLLEKALKEAAIFISSYPDCTNIPVEVRQVDKLRVREASQFDVDAPAPAELFVREGLPNYVAHVWQAYQQLLEDGGGELIFNITGGYKGMIPIARDLSMVLSSHAHDRGHEIASELCYLHEDGKELIHIPALPLRFDWSRIPANLLVMADDDQGIVPERVPTKDIDEHSAYFAVDHRTNTIHRSVLGEVVWAIGKYINDPLNLDGTQVIRFRDALMKAFPSHSELRQMVRHQLDEHLDEIINMQNNLKDICFSLIEWSQATGRTRVLLLGARKENSGNPLLQQFAKQFDE